MSKCAVKEVNPSLPAGSVTAPAPLKAKATVVKFVEASSTKMTWIFFLVSNS